ncbi:MAG: hypothetical protein A2014_06760 [Spirochaetes bacterium GWF1_49_6]|nr:MAG: hypothetical protein A2014_06760 [Spirochaetes bacterium GWF1_49_6]
MLAELLQLKYFAILESIVLMTVFLYYGHGRVLTKYFDDNKAYRLHFLAAFVLFFIVPLVTLFIYGKNPMDFGLKLGDWQNGLLWAAGGWVVAVIVAITNSPIPEMRKQYPFSKKAMDSPRSFFTFELTYLFLYYTGWEFLFRGFMLFTLAEIDPMLGILVPVIPSVLLHIGHPASETWSAVIAGVVFGYVAWSTGSILYPWLIHAAFGISMDIAIYLRAKGRKTHAAS